MLGQIPAGRFAEAEEMAAVALFLGSDDSLMIETKAEHRIVDGGFTIRCKVPTEADVAMRGLAEVVD